MKTVMMGMEMKVAKRVMEMVKMTMTRKVTMTAKTRVTIMTM